MPPVRTIRGTPVPSSSVHLDVVALCLDDRPDRRQAVERELRRVGLPYTVSVATRPTDAGGYSSPGLRGCNESHLRALREARDRGVDAVLICEDDLMVLRGFERAWPRILDTLGHTDWEFAHLGYKGRFLPSTDAAVEPVSRDLGRLLSPKLDTLHFYAVHRRILPDLVEYLEHRIDRPPFAPIDGLLNDFRAERGILPLVAVPNLGVQRPSRSNLWPPGSPLSRILHDGRMRPLLASWVVVKRGLYEAQARWLARQVRRAP